MIFIPLLILGIAFYFSGKRIFSAIIFFFFLTAGFQIIPEFLFDTGTIISKSLDFALFHVLGIFLIGCFKYEDFVPKNKVTKCIFIFIAFIIISMAVNRFIYYVETIDIIKTPRFFFFVLAYFVFRRYSKEDIEYILRILFYITFFMCIIYVIQSIVGIPLLTGENYRGEFGKLNRYYNIPILYYFFVFYAFFANPLHGRIKIFSIIIFILVSIVAQHRAQILIIFFLSFWGIYISQGGLKGIIKYIFIAGILSLPILNILLERFDSKNISKDINSVFSKSYIDFENDMLSEEATFLFRMALFYERLDYVTENKLSMLFGVGFMHEYSAITDNKFDFKIGLLDEDHRVVQLESSDIAWSSFILRLGFAGTILFLCIYIITGICFYKNRKNNRLILVALLYIIELSLSSMTSALLFYSQTIIPVFFVYIIREQNNRLENEYGSED